MTTQRPRRRSLARAAGLLVAALVAAGATALLAAGPASADEIYPRPQSGQIPLQGHGYGHGIGMSSWSTYGAARQGVRWPDILSRFYPGTTQTGFTDRTIRVDVRGDMGSQMAFPATAGLWATFGANHDGAYPIGTTGVDGRSVVVFQAVTSGSGAVQLRYLTDGGGWYDWGPATSQLNVTNQASGVVTAWGSGSRIASYTGEFRAVPISGSVVPVAAISLEEYVRGVVPHEAIPSWPSDALSAQSVASRTFGAYALAHPRAAAYDICDTTSCQVFKGSGYYASTNAAVANTSGVVLTYGGSPIVAYFSASGGGWTASGGQPYLPAQADPWDTAAVDPNRDWTASIPVASVESIWPSIGRLTQTRVVTRDGAGEWGGRVRQLAFDGTSGSVTVTGDDMRSRFGLKSTYFTPLSTTSKPSYPRDFTGDGRGDAAYLLPQGQVMVAPGGSGGQFGAAQLWGGAVFGGARAVFAAGAWDSDGLADVMSVDSGGNLVLWPGSTPGSNQRQLASGLSGFDSFFSTGDFDGDGLTDVIGRRASDQTLWMWSATISGGLQGAPRQVTPSMFQVKTFISPGDFDGDGRADMMTVDWDGTITLYSGSNTGGWIRNLRIGKEWDGTTGWFSVGDTSGDGVSDIYFSTSDGALWRLTGTGYGPFAGVSQVGGGWGGDHSPLH